jgi:hypothetical protein
VLCASLVQRRLIGPAFTTQAARIKTPIFFQKAEQLRVCWDALISEETPNIFPSSSSPVIPLSTQQVQSGAAPMQTVIDIMHWTSRATFDVIGLAGFDYHFNSLQDELDEVSLSYRRLFNAAENGPGLKGVLQIYFPFIEKILVGLGFLFDFIQLSMTLHTARRLFKNGL